MTINKKISVVVLSLFILFAAAMPADAQWGRGRNRDRGTSGKEKAGWIVGGAAAGAVLGGLLNGKKGAILGGVVGAGAGTGVAVLKDRNDDDRYEGYRRRRYSNRRYDGIYNGNYNRYYRSRR